MPSIEDINTLKQTINSLAHEHEILAKRGDVLEDVQPPDRELDSDLETLLDSTDGFEDSNADDILAGLEDEPPQSVFTEDDELGLNSLDETTNEDIISGLVDSVEDQNDDFLSDSDTEESENIVDDIFADLDEPLDSDNETPAGIEEPLDLEDDLLDDLDLENIGNEEDQDSVDALVNDTEQVDDFSSDDSDALLNDLGLDETENIDLNDLAEADGLSELDDLNIDELGAASDNSDSIADLDTIDTLENTNDISEIDDLDDSLIEPGDEIDQNLGEDLEDLGELGDIGEGLEDLGELGDISEGLEDLGELDSTDNLESMPDVESRVEELEESVAEEEESLDLEDDFGLNELSEDFLEDLSDGEDAQAFSLNDFGDEYNLGDDSFFSNEVGVDLGDLEQGIAAEEIVEELFELTEDELEELYKRLFQLPANLKLAIEIYLANPETSIDKTNKVVDALLNNDSVRSLASMVGKLTKKKITIPKGYEKQDLEQLEREKAGLAYFSKNEVFPKLKIGLIAFFGVWLVAVLSYNFLYRPLKAKSLYKTGYEYIFNDQYDQANYYFEEAFFGWKLSWINVKGWPDKDWFYEYAHAYRERRQFDEAELKYKQLLEAYPDQLEGRLEYARMLSAQQARYQDAEIVLKEGSLSEMMKARKGEIEYSSIAIKEITEIKDYDQILLLADNYFSWSDEDPDKLEDARFTYATLRERFGGMDEINFRFASLWLKTDNEPYIEAFFETYKDEDKIKIDDRYRVEVLSEIASWLLDNGRSTEAKDLLLRLEKVDDTVPDLHYQLARFFRITLNEELEKEALRNTFIYLRDVDVLNKKYIFMEIDAHKRYGEWHIRWEDFDKAQSEFDAAIDFYERKRERNLIGTSPIIGELYARMGDLNYFEFLDYDSALRYYNEAEKNLYIVPEIRYRRGYLYYHYFEDYDKALYEFYQADKSLPNNSNIMIALANSMMKRKDYFSALSYYEKLVTMVSDDLLSIDNFMPDDRAEHKSLLIDLIIAYNNKGVAQYHVGQRSPRADLSSKALSQFTQASTYYDRLTRDPETLVRIPINDISYDNRMLILYPEQQERDELLIYEQLLKDITQLSSEL